MDGGKTSNDIIEKFGLKGDIRKIENQIFFFSQLLSRYGGQRRKTKFILQIISIFWESFISLCI